MFSIIDKLESEISRMAEGSTIHLVEIQRAVSKRFIIIRVFLDREDGFFSHQDCVEWNNKIKDFLDGTNLLPGDYRLEISSPGVGRNLKERWEFEKNREKILRVEFSEDEGAISEFSGALIEVDEAGIRLKNKETEKRITWENLRRARVQLPW